MELQRDSRGHLFAEVENIRVTYVPADERHAGTEWAGSDVIRLQAYKSLDSKALHMGAELPIRSPAEFGQLVGALCQVYLEGGQ